MLVKGRVQPRTPATIIAHMFHNLQISFIKLIEKTKRDYTSKENTPELFAV